ncbi:MAG TPA: 4-alpha-glucanotransferase, partial [Lysobacter sp.]|nr:4-alpha-glucanotransferase [Lysobacter sp.]
MSRPTLADLAERAGIAVHWEDFRGRTRKVSPDSLRRVLAALELPCENDAQLADSHARFVASARPDHLPPLLTATCGEPIELPAAAARAATTFRLIHEDGSHHDGRLPQRAAGAIKLPPMATPGYHRLQLGDRHTTLAVAPRRCTSERDLRGDATGRSWGLAAQLYGLQMRGDGGIGTYRALGHLAARLARDGAAALAVSPVHAMFSAEPAHRSPYSPSSRLLLNALHVDPRDMFGDAANDARETLGLGTVLAHFEAQPLIDWGAAGGARLSLLRFLHDQYFMRDPKLVRSLARFRTESGEVLEDHARFEALHAHFHSQGLWSWRDWPAAYRDPGSDAVARFAQDHAEG